MELIVNHQYREYNHQDLTVQQLLDLENPAKQKGIAVAVNDTIIARNLWAHTSLQSNDKVLIITATQGG